MKVWFVDRDGTVMRDVGYCNSVEKLCIYCDATDAIARALKAGIKVAIVSNQSGVARGMVTPEALVDISVEIATVVGQYRSFDAQGYVRKPFWAEWSCEQAARWPMPLLLPVDVKVPNWFGALTKWAELLFVYCPHHPDQMCSCRKPQIGMAIAALCYWYGKDWHGTMQQLAAGNVPRWMSDIEAVVFGDKQSDKEFASGLPFEAQYGRHEAFVWLP